MNITPGERLARMLVGMTAIVTGTVLLTGGGSPLVITLEVLLIATGADLLITGALGHCPLYHKLSHMPRSLRGTR